MISDDIRQTAAPQRDWSHHSSSKLSGLGSRVPGFQGEWLYYSCWMGWFSEMYGWVILFWLWMGWLSSFFWETHQNVFAVQCLRPRMAFCHPNVEVHYLQCVNGTSSGEQVFGNDGKFHRPLTFTPRPHELLGVPGRETLVWDLPAASIQHAGAASRFLRSVAIRKKTGSKNLWSVKPTRS